MPAFERLARRARRSGSSRTPARRSAPRTPTARTVGARGNLRRLRLLPEQADHDGGGRRGRLRRRPTPRSASTPSATRAARPTWAGSTTTGSASTTGSTTSPARSGSRSSSASTRCSRRARASRRSTRRRWPDVEGLDLPCPDADGDRRSWFVYVVQLPPGVDRDAAVDGDARARGGHEALPAGDPPDELLPRALRPPRGRVPGLRGRGRAARSRCRSSRELTDGEVEQVVEALRAVIGQHPHAVGVILEAQVAHPRTLAVIGADAHDQSRHEGVRQP